MINLICQLCFLTQEEVQLKGQLLQVLKKQLILYDFTKISNNELGINYLYAMHMDFNVFAGSCFHQN
jgi:hypothetical protein